MQMQRLLFTKINENIISAICEEMTIKSAQVLSDQAILGNVYVGRVENVSKNIQAAFIEFEKGKKGYYAFRENDTHIFLNPKNNDKVCQGDLLLVQVSREAVKTKEPTLSSHISLPGRLCAVSLRFEAGMGASVFVSKKIDDEQIRCELKVCVKNAMDDVYSSNEWGAVLKAYPNVKLDVIVRTNAENAPKEMLRNEVLKLCYAMCQMLNFAKTRTAYTKMYSATSNCLEDVQNMRASNLEKIVTDVPFVYDSIKEYLLEYEPDSIGKLVFYDDEQLPLCKLYNVEGQLTNALRSRVWLPSGGYLVIEPTEALTVIDVNTGKFTGNRKLQKNTYMIINKQAADEIAKQLVLRNLSGIIIVDFINLETLEERKELMCYLSEVLKRDAIPTSVVDMTKLGLVEITRKKIKKPLHEMLKGVF